MSGIGFEVVIILLLVLANGIFSMAEISVVAARKVRLQQRAEEGDHRAKAALELAQDPAQFLSTVQVGITLIGIMAGAYGGATLSEPLAAVHCRRAAPGALRRGRGARPGRRRHHPAVADPRRARAEEHRPAVSRARSPRGSPVR